MNAQCDYLTDKVFLLSVGGGCSSKRKKKEKYNSLAVEPQNAPVRKRWKCPNCNHDYEEEVCPSCQPMEPDLSSDVGPPERNISRDSTTNSAVPSQASTSGESFSNDLPDRAFLARWKCNNCNHDNEEADEMCQSCQSPRPECENLNESEQRGASTSPSLVVSGSLNSGPSANHPTNNFEFENLQPSKTIGDNRLRDEKESENEIEKLKASKSNNQGTLVGVGSEIYVGSNSNSTQWLRPHQILSFESLRPGQFLLGDASPSDIRQGGMESCWFDGSLSAVAKHKYLLERIVLTKKVNEEGIYAIRLHKDGCWHTVIIDDKLPCDEECKLLFSNTEHLWVALIQKAAAMLHNGYETLGANGGGRPLEALTMLTGSPCDSWPVCGEGDGCDGVWSKMNDASGADFVSAASCGGRSDDIPEAYAMVGLVYHHTYSIIETRLETTDDKNQIRLIKLRNPHGDSSWSGEYEIFPPNPSLKERLCPEPSEAGTFWMDLMSFMSYFSRIDICKIYADSWNEVRMEGVFADSSAKPLAAYMLVLSKKCDVDFHLWHQVDRALEQSGAQTYDGYICVFEAGRQTDDGTMTLGRLVACSVRQVKTPLRCSELLESGAYLVLCFEFQHWPSATMIGNGDPPTQLVDKYVLEVYSGESFTLLRCEITRGGLPDAVIQMTMKEGTSAPVGDHVTIHSLNKSDTGMIVVAENHHPDTMLVVTYDCSEVRSLKSTRGAPVTTDAIAPRHRQVLFALAVVSHRTSELPTNPSVNCIWFNPATKSQTLPPGEAHDPPLPESAEELHEARPMSPPIP